MDCDVHRVADGQLTRLRLFLLFVIAVPCARVRLVAPGVRLRTGHDACDVWIIAFLSFATSAPPRPRFRTPGGLFLLFFSSSALSLALASR